MDLEHLFDAREKMFRKKLLEHINALPHNSTARIYLLHAHKRIEEMSKESSKEVLKRAAQARSLSDPIQTTLPSTHHCLAAPVSQRL